MKNVMLNNRLGKLMQSLVLTSFLPFLMATYHHSSYFVSSYQSMVMMDTIKATKVSTCQCDASTSTYIDSFSIDAPAGLTFETLVAMSSVSIDTLFATNTGYKIAVRTQGTTAYRIVLESTINGLYMLNGSACAATPHILGEVSTCLSSTTTYTLPGAAPYSWALSGGGSITSSTATSATIAWGSAAGVYTLTATNTSNPCALPITTQITLGAAVNEPLGCNNRLNVSLDSTCTRRLGVEELVTTKNTANTAVAIILLDANNKPIPNNTLNSNHIGQVITAKAVDGCGKNECWGTIVLEDKLPPIIECKADITISCFDQPDLLKSIKVQDCSPYSIIRTAPDAVTSLTCQPFIRSIKSTFIARDQYGNESKPCSVTVHVTKFPLDSLVFPKDSITLSCNQLVNGTVSPAISDYPTVFGRVLDQTFYDDCLINITYTDVIIPLGGKTKIIRSWVVTDFSCSPNIEKTAKQLIVVADAQAPRITSCPSDITVSTSGNDCTALVTMPAIPTKAVTDDCDPSPIHSIVLGSGQVVKPNEIVKLNLGLNSATYFVTDASGKRDSCIFTITVEDKTRPVVVCKDSIVISIVGKYTALLPSMINLNSYDNCTSVSLKIKRMESPDSLYRDSLYLTCEDANTSIMVNLRADDENGNRNFCMVRVKVEDKLPPVLQVPSDVTITCAEFFLNRPLSTYGEVYFREECNPSLLARVDTVLNGCKEGTITRTWTASDGIFTVVKSQKIHVVNSTKLNPDSIVPPKDITINGMCNISNYRDSIPKLVLPNLACTVLAVNFKDDVYQVQNPTTSNCYKVLRTYQILNWCESPSGQVVKTFVQTITIENHVPPTINLLTQNTTLGSDLCTSGTYTLRADGADDCTPDADLIWAYEVFDTNKVKVAQGNGRGKTFIATGNLPLGVYTIDWILRDGCGNVASRTQPFTLKYTKPPSFAVIDTLVIGLTAMFDTEMACIGTDSLAKSVSQACGYPVRLSFSQTNVNDTTKCFDCSNIGYNIVTVYGSDPFGNTESVKFVLDVQDNNDVDICRSFNSCITWPRDTTIRNCPINLLPTTINSRPIVAANCGCTQFETSFVDNPANGSILNGCQTIERQHTVTFRCNNRTNTFRRTQLITIINGNAPTLSCASEVVRANATTGCSAQVIVPAPTVTDLACNTGITVQYRRGTGALLTAANASGSYDVGTTLVTYVVTNACGRSSTCTVQVQVADNAAPICRVRNISIQLNAQGQAVIGDPSIFNNGTTDACNNLPIRFAVSKSTFDCTNLSGATQVDVTTTDASGNASTCTANVTVVDTVRPIGQVINITRELTSANQTITIAKRDLVSNARDNCAVVDTVLSKTSFTCADLGSNTVRVVIRDGSGNSASYDAIVTIVDRVAPICRLKSAIVTVNGGAARIDSSFIDNGSSDPCGGIVRFTVSPSNFTCSDIGVRRVTATITDAAGNSTVCDTTVTVVDGGQLVCVPKDITVFLDATGSKTITAEDVDGGSGTGCGNPVQKSINITNFTCADAGQTRNVLLTITRPGNTTTSVCTSRVTVRDTLPPTLVCAPENVTINCENYNGTIPASVPRPRIVGGCNGAFRLDSTIIRLTKPCNLDTLTRTYRLSDNSGNLLGVCVQTIMVLNTRVLDTSHFNLPAPIVTLNSCTTTNPSATGGAVTVKASTNVGCAKIGISYRDAYLNNSCTDTLRRTWTVIDSCKGNTLFTYLQRIFINDTFAPVLGAVRDTVIYNDGMCGAFFTAPVPTVTDCDTRLILSNTGQFATNSNSLNASGRYPIGRYAINLIATDRCGNSASRTLNLEVRDTVPSGFVCTNIVRTINAEGRYLLNASEFVSTYGGFCNTTVNSLRYVMRKGGGDTISTRGYVCNELRLVNGVFQVNDTFEILVYNDLGTSNNVVHRCIATVQITAGGNCQNARAQISTLVLSQNGEAIENFEVRVKGITDQGTAMTNYQGLAINKVEMGKDVLVSPYKNTEALNGVNILDILQMQRHLLGISKLPNPYAMIAADVNGDKRISLADIVELRKLILGQIETFSEVPSWIPVDASYRFASTTDALSENYPTYVAIDQLDHDTNVQFVGVKSGDVDQSYRLTKLNAGQTVESRSLATLQLPNIYLEKGKSYSIEMETDQSLLGIQTTLTGNGISSLDFGTNNQWYTHQTNSDHKIVAYSTKGLSQPTLNFVATKTGWLRDMVNIASSSIGYDVDLSAINLDLRWKEVVINTMEVSAPYPNPWANTTALDIQANTGGVANIVLVDMTGKIVQKIERTLTKGANHIVLTKSSNMTAGLYTMMVKTSESQKTYKMIVTD